MQHEVSGTLQSDVDAQSILFYISSGDSETVPNRCKRHDERSRTELKGDCLHATGGTMSHYRRIHTFIGVNLIENAYTAAKIKNQFGVGTIK